MNKHVRRTLFAALTLGLLFLVAAIPFGSAAASAPASTRSFLNAPRSLDYAFRSLLPSLASPACGAGLAALSTDTPGAARAGSRTYGGLANDGARAIVPTKDGGYIVAGYTDSFGPGWNNPWLFKVDGLGNVVWQKAYGGTGIDRTVSVAPTNDGGYVVAGNRAWVFKLDRSGNVLWQKTYNGTNISDFRSIAITNDGGYIVVGSISFAPGTSSAWVLNLDGSGNVLWQKAYGDGRLDLANSVVPTEDGGYAVAGLVNADPEGLYGDAWVFKLDPSGKVEWQEAYGGLGSEWAHSIAPTKDGGYVVAADSDSFAAGDNYGWVFKLDKDGMVLWQKAFGSPGFHKARSMAPTFDGGYIVAGHGSSGAATDFNAWLFKLDPFGKILWQRTYGGAISGQADTVMPTPDGGYVAAGEAVSLGAGYSDAWLLRLDDRGGLGKNCSIVGTSSATATDTAAAIADTNATVSDTTVMGVDSNATVTDTNAQTATQCPR